MATFSTVIKQNVNKIMGCIYNLLGRSDEVSGNDIITNERDIGNVFNAYFTSISHELNVELPLLDSNFSWVEVPCNLNSISFRPVSLLLHLNAVIPLSN